LFSNFRIETKTITKKLTYFDPDVLGVPSEIQVDEEGGNAADEARIKEQHVHGPDDTDRAAEQVQAELIVRLALQTRVVVVQVVHLQNRRVGDVSRFVSCLSK
jgi:hypothetical protein